MPPQVDRVIPGNLGNFAVGLVAPLLSLYAVAVSAPPALALLLAVALVALVFARTFLLTARDLKRLDSTTKSPVYALFNEVR